MCENTTSEVYRRVHTPVDLYVTLGELLTLGEEVGGEVGVEKRVLRRSVTSWRLHSVVDSTTPPAIARLVAN